MSLPRFRSTAAYTQRVRQTVPTVDRATFVIFTMDERVFAVPVELVERVLRLDAQIDHDHVLFAKRQVRLIDLRRALDRSPVAPATRGAMGERLIIFSVQDTWIAARVDSVLEVATIDASLVQPIAPAESATLPAGSRGRFSRQANVVIVLDMVRVLRALFDRERADRGSIPLATP